MSELPLARHFFALHVACERLLDGDVSTEVALVVLQSSLYIGDQLGLPSSVVLADQLDLVRSERKHPDGPDGGVLVA